MHALLPVALAQLGPRKRVLRVGRPAHREAQCSLHTKSSSSNKNTPPRSSGALRALVTYQGVAAAAKLLKFAGKDK